MGHSPWIGGNHQTIPSTGSFPGKNAGASRPFCRQELHPRRLPTARKGRPLAVVIGACTGIGRELAKCCTREGFDLAVVADEPIGAAAAELEALGAKVDVFEADLATLEGVDRLYDVIGGGPVAALLANAGRGLGKGFLDQDFGDVMRVVNTNITGTIYLNPGKLVATCAAQAGPEDTVWVGDQSRVDFPHGADTRAALFAQAPRARPSKRLSREERPSNVIDLMDALRQSLGRRDKRAAALRSSSSTKTTSKPRSRRAPTTR